MTVTPTSAAWQGNVIHLPLMVDYIGSGTVSNQGPDGDPGKPVSAGGLGYSCIAEIRMIEQIASGEATTRFMRPGDTVRVEMRDAAGHSIFGAIEQTMVAI